MTNGTSIDPAQLLSRLEKLEDDNKNYIRLTTFIKTTAVWHSVAIGILFVVLIATTLYGQTVLFDIQEKAAEISADFTTIRDQSQALSARLDEELAARATAAVEREIEERGLVEQADLSALEGEIASQRQALLDPLIVDLEEQIAGLEASLGDRDPDAGPLALQVSELGERFNSLQSEVVPLISAVPALPDQIAGLQISVDDIVTDIRQIDQVIASLDTVVAAFASTGGCPTGWHEVEELRGRFIIGAGQGANEDGTELQERPYGVTGGQELVRMREHDLPRHTHQITDSDDINPVLIVRDNATTSPNDIPGVRTYNNDLRLVLLGLEDRQGFELDYGPGTSNFFDIEVIPPYLALTWCSQREEPLSRG